MSDSLVVNVRQILQYPPKAAAQPTDAVLVQSGGLGGPYQVLTSAALVSTALQGGPPLGVNAAPPADALDGIFASNLYLSPTEGGALWWNSYFNGADVYLNSGPAAFAALNPAGWYLDLFKGGQPGAPVGAPAATVRFNLDGTSAFPGRVSASDPLNPADLVTNSWMARNTVSSWNGRTGAVQFMLSDITLAGGAPLRSPHFTDTPTVPDIKNIDQCDGQAVNTEFAQRLVFTKINDLLYGHPFVWSWNGRTGDICLSANDVAGALHADPANARAPTPSPVSWSDRIATTKFVQGNIASAAEATLSTVDSWIRLGAVTYVGATAPVRPRVGRLWYDTVNDTMLMWNGFAWVQSGGIASVATRDTPPPNPNSGDLWWDTSDGNLFVFWINPVTNHGQWIIAHTASGPPGPPGPGLVLTGSVPDASIPGALPVPGNPGDAYLDLATTPHDVWLWVPDTPGDWVNIGPLGGASAFVEPPALPAAASWGRTNAGGWNEVIALTGFDPTGVGAYGRTSTGGWVSVLEAATFEPPAAPAGAYWARTSSGAWVQVDNLYLPLAGGGTVGGTVNFTGTIQQNGTGIGTGPFLPLAGGTVAAATAVGSTLLTVNNTGTGNTLFVPGPTVGITQSVRMAILADGTVAFNYTNVLPDTQGYVFTGTRMDPNGQLVRNFSPGIAAAGFRGWGSGYGVFIDLNDAGPGFYCMPRIGTTAIGLRIDGDIGGGVGTFGQTDIHCDHIVVAADVDSTASLLLDLRAGFVSRFNVSPTGRVGISSLANLASYNNILPNDGDLWYDGTNLNFRRGATTVVVA